MPGGGAARRGALALLDVGARCARRGAAAGPAGGPHLPRPGRREAPPPGRRRHQPAGAARGGAGDRSPGPSASSRPAATRCSSWRGSGADRRRLIVVPCGVDVDALPAGRAGRAAACRPPDRLRGPAGRAQGRRRRHPGARPACRASSWWSRAGRRRRAWTTTPRRRRLRAWPRGARAWRTGSTCAAAIGREAVAALLRSADRGRCACRGTSRSGSSRSRRWPAACRSWRPRWAGWSTPSSHGVTGVHVPPRRPDRIAEAVAGLLADPARRRRARRRRRAAGQAPLHVGPGRGRHPRRRTPPARRGARRRPGGPAGDRP